MNSTYRLKKWDINLINAFNRYHGIISYDKGIKRAYYRNSKIQDTRYTEEHIQFIQSKRW